MNPLTRAGRAYLMAEGEKRFCTLMALQFAESMAETDGGCAAFQRHRDKFREYAARLAKAEADMALFARQDFEEVSARPLFDQTQAEAA